MAELNDKDEQSAEDRREGDGEDKGEGDRTPADRVLEIVALHPLLFFGLAALLLVGPHVLPPTQISQLSYDAPDSFIHLWNFWWTKTWITGLANPYWTDLFFHPFGTSLAVHGYALPYSILLTPLQLLLPGALSGTTGLAISFNLVVFVSFVLSGFGAYRLALFATDHRVGSLLAGVVFAFMPFHFLNMARFNLLCVEFLPFYVHALLVLWRSPSRGRAIALALWLALCFYTSLEYALYLLIFSALWGVYVLISDRANVNAARLIALGQAALLFVVLASPLLSQQVRPLASSQSVPVEREIDEVVYYSPALLSFFTPSRVHPLYGDVFRFAGEYPDADRWGMRSETSVSLLTWALVGLAIAGVRRGGRTFWLLAAALFLVLTLGPQLRMSGTWLTETTLPYRWLYELFPPLRGGRDPTRLFPLAMLMLSVLAAFGTRTLLERVGERRRALLGVVLLALVIFESLTQWRPTFAPRLPPVYEDLAGEPGRGPIIDMTHTTTAMLAQTVHGRPIGFVWGIALRGAPVFEEFGLERVFRQPRLVLDLAPRERARSLDTLRSDIRQRPVDQLLFPSSPVSTRQSQLARLLGAHVSSRGRYYVADFRDLSASP